MKLLNDITLKNVLYVPKFCFNLIFVSKLSKDLHCSKNFNSNGCFVQEYLMKKPLLLGRETNALYFLQDSTLNQCSKGVKNNKVATVYNVDLPNNNDARLWHLRMGHLPFQ